MRNALIIDSSKRFEYSSNFLEINQASRQQLPVLFRPLVYSLVRFHLLHTLVYSLSYGGMRSIGLISAKLPTQLVYLVKSHPGIADQAGKKICIHCWNLLYFTSIFDRISVERRAKKLPRQAML